MYVCFYYSSFPLVRHAHSKNELEEVRDPVMAAPPVVGTTDKNPDPVLAQNPALRVDKHP